MTVYEISAELMAFQELAEEEEVDEQAYLDTLEGLQGELGDKLDAYSKVMTNNDSDIAGLDAEIKRLQAKKQAKQRVNERMKATMYQVMAATGQRKIETKLFKFSIAKNPPKVVMDADVKDIPLEYAILQDPKADTAKIKEALKAGEVLPFAHLENGESLRIK